MNAALENKARPSSFGTLDEQLTTRLRCDTRVNGQVVHLFMNRHEKARKVLTVTDPSPYETRIRHMAFALKDSQNLDARRTFCQGWIDKLVRLPNSNSNTNMSRGGEMQIEFSGRGSGSISAEKPLGQPAIAERAHKAEGSPTTFGMPPNWASHNAAAGSMNAERIIVVRSPRRCCTSSQSRRRRWIESAGKTRKCPERLETGLRTVGEGKEGQARPADWYCRWDLSSKSQLKSALRCEEPGGMDEIQAESARGYEEEAPRTILSRDETGGWSS
ncbi:hypothetical protein EDD18DRAFT_1116494 [Armillaria luteobubalina]|uniref:Uncharacterized protein n=1 Tax=Armillaria luteobubalina TaxID=153913 RepID=A0AA39TZS5_9AGAR|nr:hypothetical protein EDD18DRAFT_1116494 [Armillaria luteobubalina]